MIGNLVRTYQRRYLIGNVIVVNFKIAAVGQVSNAIVACFER